MGQRLSRSKRELEETEFTDPWFALIKVVRATDRSICLSCVNLICACIRHDQLRPIRSGTMSSDWGIVHHKNIQELVFCGYVCSVCEGIANLLPQKLRSSTSTSTSAMNTILLKEILGYEDRLLGFQFLYDESIHLRAYTDSSM
jgi:hypothetical protein